jgi:uncharacterized protein YegP (UPF0339 family)
MYRQFNKNQYRTKSKYGNVSKTFEGRTYDSKREAQHAEELAWRKKAGEIEEIIPQYKIDLRVDDKHFRNYYIDFKVILSDGTIQYHEVKGYETEVWKMKWRFLEMFQDQILEPGAELLVIK